MKRLNVFKILLVITLLGIISVLDWNTIDAKSKEIEQHYLFEETITLRNSTTHFTIGFVRVDFQKNILPSSAYPITFHVRLYAEDNKVYIEFDPDVEQFFKHVIIHVYHYEGYLYDQATNQLIYLDIHPFMFKVPHFSRWCFVR